jgi:hypothetical protein
VALEKALRRDQGAKGPTLSGHLAVRDEVDRASILRRLSVPQSRCETIVLIA